MTETPPDTGMGAEAPATTTRSTRRTRRLAIIGALALVLIAGAVLVGTKVTGSRSGTVSTGAYGTVTCTRGSTTTYKYSTAYTPKTGTVRFTWLNSGNQNVGSFTPTLSNGVFSANTTAMGFATQITIDWKLLDGSLIGGTWPCSG